MTYIGNTMFFAMGSIQTFGNYGCNGAFSRPSFGYNNSVYGNSRGFGGYMPQMPAFSNNNFCLNQSAFRGFRGYRPQMPDFSNMFQRLGSLIGGLTGQNPFRNLGNDIRISSSIYKNGGVTNIINNIYVGGSSDSETTFALRNGKIVKTTVGEATKNQEAEKKMSEGHYNFGKIGTENDSKSRTTVFGGLKGGTDRTKSTDIQSQEERDKYDHTGWNITEEKDDLAPEVQKISAETSKIKKITATPTKNIVGGTDRAKTTDIQSQEERDKYDGTGWNTTEEKDDLAPETTSKTTTKTTTRTRGFGISRGIGGSDRSSGGGDFGDRTSSPGGMGGC